MSLYDKVKHHLIPVKRIVLHHKIQVPTPPIITSTKPIQNKTTFTQLSHTQLIGIQLSPVCIDLLKNHVKTNCPTYKQLQVFDNTDPHYAGQWTNEGGYYHRLSPEIKNSELLNKNPTVVMVDPYSDYTTRARMIIVQPDNFNFVLPLDMVNDNHTRYEYQNVYVTGCTTATVAPNIKLINQTLQYLTTACKDANFLIKKSIVTGDKPFSYDNPYSSLWYNIAQLNLDKYHAKYCLTGQCVNVDPYKKPGW